MFSKQRNKYIYVISDPEMVKQVLITNNRNYKKGVGIDRVKILLENGIMVSEGDYWKRQRRMMQPSFHRKIIENLSGDTIKANQQMLAKWLKDTDEINLTDELMWCVFFHQVNSLIITSISIFICGFFVLFT